MMLLYVLSIMIHIKHPWKHVLLKKSKKIALLGFLLCSSAFCLSGCASGSGEKADNFELSSSLQDTYKGKDFTLTVDHEANNILYQGNDGEEYQLIRDVFPLSADISCIFVHGNLCYYLMENDEDNGIYVRCINLTSLSDQFIYSDMEENTEDLYGLKQDDSTIAEDFNNLNTASWFFVTDKYIYLNVDNSIKQINRLTHYHKIIADDVSNEPVTYDHGVLSYTNYDGKKVLIL